MQTGSGPIASRAPMVVTVIAIVLAVIGVGAALSGAADKPSDQVASSGGSSTTTEVSTTLLSGDGGGTTTTVASGGTTTTGRSTGTTAKTSATTTPGGVGDCPTPPQATADPGAQQPAAIGTFTYVPCDGNGESTDVRIAAGTNSNGVTRREVTEKAGQFEQTATEAYGSSGVVQEALTIKTGFADLRCDWNPDVLVYPVPLALGKTWSADSKCTVKNPQPGGSDITLHLTASAKVSGKVQYTVGGTAVNTWVIDAHVVLETPNGTIDVTQGDFYDPTRGIAVYRHSESKSSEGSVVRTDHLKSLTPAKNS